MPPRAAGPVHGNHRTRAPLQNRPRQSALDSVSIPIQVTIARQSVHGLDVVFDKGVPRIPMAVSQLPSEHPTTCTSIPYPTVFPILPPEIRGNTSEPPPREPTAKSHVRSHNTSWCAAPENGCMTQCLTSAVSHLVSCSLAPQRAERPRWHTFFLITRRSAWHRERRCTYSILLDTRATGHPSRLTSTTGLTSRIVLARQSEVKRRLPTCTCPRSRTN